MNRVDRLGPVRVNPITCQPFVLEVLNWDHLSDGYHVRDQIYEKSIVFDDHLGYDTFWEFPG